MEQYEMHAPRHSEQFLDTVAFGSMLVFASVMPPLDGIARDGEPVLGSEGLMTTEPDQVLDLSPEETST